MRFLLPLLVSWSAFAGFFELGISGSYRETFITEEIFSKSSSTTGSLSYYYMERSAVQFSFTQAVRRDHSPLLNSVTNETQDELNITEVNIYGVDLVLSFSDRKAPIQPFIKAGIAQLEKKFTRQLEGEEADTPTSAGGQSLSAGLGVKFLLSETLSFNFSMDGWSNPITEDLSSSDIRVLGGVSWFL